LEYCYWHAYSMPTQQAHSTVLAITFAMAACVGHVVLLKMLRVQNSFFSLGLEDEIAKHEVHCKEAWPGIEKDVGKGM
jgi:hypothetical protein